MRALEKGNNYDGFNHSNSQVATTSYILWSILRKWKSLFLSTLIGCLFGFLIAVLYPKVFLFNDNQIDSLNSFVQLHSVYQRQVRLKKDNPFLTMQEQDFYLGSISYNIVLEKEADVGAVYVQLQELSSKDIFWTEIANIAEYSDFNLSYLEDALKISVIKPVFNEIPLNYNSSITVKLSILGIDRQGCEKAITYISDLYEADLLQIKGISTFSEVSGTAKKLEISTWIDGIREKYNAIEYRILDSMNREINPSSTASMRELNDIRVTLAQAQYIKNLDPTFEHSNELFKFAVSGAIVGLIIGLVIILSNSTINPTISFWETVSYNFGIPVLACIRTKKLFFLDSVFFNFTHGRPKLANSLEYVKAFLSKDEANDVIVCGDTKDATVSEMKKQMETLLKGNVHCVGLFSIDSNAISLLSDQSEVVFIFHLDHTGVVEAEQQILLCKKFGVEISGVLLIQS